MCLGVCIDFKICIFFPDTTCYQIKTQHQGWAGTFSSCWLVRSSKGPSKSSIGYCHCEWLPSRTIRWDPIAGYIICLSHTPWGIKPVPAWKLCPNRIVFTLLKGPMYTGREKSHHWFYWMWGIYLDSGNCWWFLDAQLPKKKKKPL